MLPNWAGNTRYIGPTGPQGPAGNNGVSGGLVLYMDSATSTTVPTLGSLLSAPNLGAQTTISYSANSATVLIATFPSPVGAIPAQFIPPGLWDMNIYAAASSLTNSPYFYWSLFQVDSDGVSNPILLADGSGAPIQIANLSSTQIIYDSPLYIPATTLPAGKRVSAYLYVTYVTGSRTAIFEFRAGAVSHIHTTIGETAYNWSTFPATNDVNIAGFTLSNVGTANITTGNITTLNNTTATIGTGNITTANITTGNIGTVNTTLVNNGSSSNSLRLQSPSNDTIVSGNRAFMTADQGSVVSATSDITLSASNGYKGRINLTTSGGYSNGINGEINLTANGAVVGIYPADYATGGLINITANTPAASLYTFTSAIKLSAASVLSYAGAVSPIGSLLGYNYIQGTLGVNIVAGSGGSANAVGTVYLYGANGTTIQNGLYTDTIYNILGGDLNLNGRSCNVNLSGNAINANTNLYMNTNAINWSNGKSIGYASNQIYMSGNGTDVVSVRNGAASFQIASNQALYLTAGTADPSATFQNTNIVMNGGNINLNSNNINSVGVMTMVSAGTINMSGGTISNLANILGSNLTISTGGNLVLKTSSTTGSVIMSNTSNSITQYGGTDIVSSNYMNMYGSAVTISNAASTNLLSLGFGTAGAQLLSSNFCRMSNQTTQNNLLLDSNAKLYSTGAITLSNASSVVMGAATTTAATGGTITDVGGRRYHTFTSSGTFTISATGGAVFEIMAIGGGGGGGCQSGGGGGAGNMIVATGSLTATSYSVAVGGGGAGGVYTVNQGQNGSSSTFGSILTALGGGGGGSYNIGGGLTGGCGGGGSELGQAAGGGRGFGSVSSPLTATSNLATRGGTGYNGGSEGAAGGGGTSADGTSHPANTSAGNSGGAGTVYRGTTYGGGGGGSQGGIYWGAPYNGGAGGAGGGGTGSSFGVSGPLVAGTAGAANTGSGGGGATAFTGDTSGFAGGSGIVIVSYPYSVGSIDLTAAGVINLNSPTNITGATSITGNTTMNGTLDMTTHDISNVGALSTSRLTTTNLATTNFNGAIATPITNNGNIGFLNNYSTGTLVGDATFQVKGPTWDGTSIKVGNLPNGIYSFQANCYTNTRRSLSAILLISEPTPGFPDVSIAQANVLDNTDYVQEYAINANISGVFYGYVVLNNTTVGGGDSFYVNIKLISGTWDGTASWNVY